MCIPALLACVSSTLWVYQSLQAGWFPGLPSHVAAHHHWAFTITSMPARDADVMARRWAGMGDCFEGRAGHNPGCIVRPALGSWSCSACVRDAPGTPGTFHIAAHQSTPGPWCRGGVGLVETVNEFAHAGRVAQAASHHLHHPELYADMTLCFWMLLQVGCHGGKSLIWGGWQIFQRAVFAQLNMF